MRVWFVNSTRRWGGVKTWTLDLVQWLAEHGHEPVVACRPGPFADKAAELGVETHVFDFGVDFSPNRIRWFSRAFRAARPDAVVCNVGKDLRTAGVAARLLGIPVVHRVGLPGDMRNVPKVRLLHAFIKPRLLVPCEFIKFGLRENLPWLKDEEITVIRTGKPCAGEETPPPDGPLRLVATSQLNPDKGHDDLLRALARLAEEGYAFRLDVLGTGSEEERLKELGRELGLDERLTWHGFQRNVRAFLRAADVFVLPSRSEGLPNTLLEAMALGLAPVARDVGGVREIWPEAMDFLLADARGGGEGMYPPLKRVLDAPPDELAGYKRIALNVCRERFDQQTQARRVAEWLAGLN